ncbi:uncharacterized protein [Anabrus simplex]|uniref:uncharacterized protein n=1 Tax=Anabrus simplex TaxID=316456 RepID=UPI0035A2954C
MSPGSVVVALFVLFVVAAEDTLDEETEVFSLSCGTGIAKFSIPKNVKIEKFRIQDIRRILTQLETAKSFLKAKEGELYNLYQDVISTPSNFEYSWLPEDSLQWFREKVQCLGKNQKVKMILPLLYTSLQNYSATFNAMKETNEHQPHEELITNINLWLRAVLCEVEFAIININMMIPKWKPLNHDALAGWFKIPHETLLKEWGVHERYSKFLQDWSYILRDVMRKKNSKRCTQSGKKDPSLSFVNPTSASSDSDDFRYETEDVSRKEA